VPATSIAPVLVFLRGKADWSQRHPGWHEIQHYILETTDKRGLRPYIRFRHEVAAAAFDVDRARWTLTTASGARVVAKLFVMASGPLHVPQIPRIKGLETFRGKVFHSAQWDHAFDLSGRNVASIGTGGSAIQYCPEIAPQVKQLYVFQRTAAWVLPRDTRSYSEATKRRFARFPWLRKLHRARLYWTNESRVWPVFHSRLAYPLQGLAKLFIRRQVKDRDLARRLTPDYTIGCKRILISNAWFPMFRRPNVELVTDGIREVRENGIVTDDGVERPVDCIILGTGFVTDPRIYLQKFPITGLPGHTLTTDWRDGAEAYYGITVSGYPNMYQLLGPNSGLGHNSAVFMIECQVHYLIQCLREVRDRKADYLDVRPQAQYEFNERVQRSLKGTVWSSGCRSWYQQADGKNFTIWPWSTWRYWLRTRRVEAADYRFARLGKGEGIPNADA
jgi:cation diffusion facilitator CzcD-associated flavoprotein CzcO